MKKISLLMLSLILAFPVLAQEDTIPQVPDVPNLEELEGLEEIEGLEDLDELNEILEETPENTRVTMGENEIFIIEENGDTTRIQLGTRGLSIVETEDGFKVDVVEMDDDENDDAISDNKDKPRKKKKFDPHYSGFEVGMNNLMNPDYTIHNQSFMNLNTAKSWNYNINFLEYGIGFGSYNGLVTGMGIEWSNYVFDGDNSIMELDDGTIVERPLTIEDYNAISKSKLMTTYLTVPLLYEVQIPAGKKRLHLSAGVVGGVKIGSRTKVKFNDGGKQKEVIKDDFSLAPLRYGATVRIGYRALNIFANYYFTPLFNETPGQDELHPFSIGLCIIPFD